MDSIKHIVTNLWKNQDQGAHQPSKNKEVKGTAPKDDPARQQPVLQTKKTLAQKNEPREKQPAANDMDQVRERLDRELSRFNFGLDFKVRDKGKIVVKVVNRDTGKVIRQIPPEEMLNLAKKLHDFKGVMLNKIL